MPGSLTDIEFTEYKATKDILNNCQYVSSMKQ